VKLGLKRTVAVAVPDAEAAGRIGGGDPIAVGGEEGDGGGVGVVLACPGVERFVEAAYDDAAADALEEARGVGGLLHLRPWGEVGRRGGDSVTRRWVCFHDDRLGRGRGTGEARRRRGSVDCLGMGKRSGLL
jgi:hypothetical protein